jgi:two-component sensor histidine kinase
MTWTGHDACEVEVPATTGFGTKVLETTIERSGGELERDWRSEGLCVRISLPLKSLRGRWSL